ncbi:MAG: hypothetical protein KAS94_08215 [Desulfobulbaceae bacterium]|nr:hypothetical protein [Desulfobulbaceae bacterium]
MDKKNRTKKGFGIFLKTIPWPWHVGLGVAVYLTLHFLAERVIPLPGQAPEEVALYTHRVIWKMIASIFQYIILTVFVLLAILSFRSAEEKRKRHINSGAGPR